MQPYTDGTEPLTEEAYRVRALIAAIVRQAVDDLKEKPPGKRSKSQRSMDEWEKDRASAVSFLVGESARICFKFLRIDRTKALSAVGLELEMIKHDRERVMYEIEDELADYFEQVLRREAAEYADPTE